MHAEEAEVMPRADAGYLEPELGQSRVRLLDDLVDGVDVGPVREPLAGEGAVLMDQMLAGRLHPRDRALLGCGEVEQLPGAAPRLARDVEVIAQQQEERLLGDERRAPDGMTIAVGLGLDGKAEPLFQLVDPPRLLLGPGEVLERRSRFAAYCRK